MQRERERETERDRETARERERESKTGGSHGVRDQAGNVGHALCAWRSDCCTRRTAGRGAFLLHAPEDE
jgi:hypothetical protein